LLAGPDGEIGFRGRRLPGPVCRSQPTFSFYSAPEIPRRCTGQQKKSRDGHGLYPPSNALQQGRCSHLAASRLRHILTSSSSAADAARGPRGLLKCTGPPAAMIGDHQVGRIQRAVAPKDRSGLSHSQPSLGAKAFRPIRTGMRIARRSKAQLHIQALQLRPQTHKCSTARGDE
jgi:hypothetical protein